MDTNRNQADTLTEARLLAVVDYITAHPQVRKSQMEQEINITPRTLQKLLQIGRRRRLIDYVNSEQTAFWVPFADAAPLRFVLAESRRLKENDRKRKEAAIRKAARKAEREAEAMAFDDDEEDRMPVRRSFVRAGELPPPHTTAPRSVFDWRPAA